MSDYNKHIKKQIERQNPWYIGSQFAWAEQESIKRIYDRRRRFFHKIIMNEIMKRGRMKLLDYGCGDGYWALFFSQIPNCNVIGVDYNLLRLERARSLIRNAIFIQADLRKRNNNLGKNDIVFCSQVIEHVKDDISFLHNIKNYLIKDGTLIIGCPNEGSLAHRFRYRHERRINTDHVHFYKEKEIKLKIKMAGFKIETIFREIFYPGWDKLYYELTSTDFGFKFLEILTLIFPSQCSDYYFECKLI